MALSNSWASRQVQMDKKGAITWKPMQSHLMEKVKPVENDVTYFLIMFKLFPKLETLM